jgi:hypothetical protein
MPALCLFAFCSLSALKRKSSGDSFDRSGSGTGTTGTASTAGGESVLSLPSLLTGSLLKRASSPALAPSFGTDFEKNFGIGKAFAAGDA